MSELRQDISETLKAAIAASTLNYMDIADIVGVSRAAISGYMKGNVSLSMEREIALLEYFGYKFEMEKPDAVAG